MSKEVSQFQKDWNEHVDIPGMLLGLGEDLEREGLVETPNRVGRAWLEFLNGYTMEPEKILAKRFAAEDSGLQIARDVAFQSLCEHHLLSFFGTITIMYEPNKEVCGLSKLSRLAECFGRRLQIQERLTNQIADAIQEYLKPKGVLVLCSAQHLCCVGRGVKQSSMYFETSAKHGKIDLALAQIMLQKGKG
jgi:GTP cyclohydrolase I